MQKIPASACPVTFFPPSLFQPGTFRWVNTKGSEQGSEDWKWRVDQKKSSKGEELRMFWKVPNFAFQTHSVVKLKMLLYTSPTAAFKLSPSKLKSRHTGLWRQTVNGRNFGTEIWNGAAEAGGMGNSFYWVHMARFWQLGGYRVGFCQKVKETVPIPAGCKMDLRLARAWQWQCFWITYLRRGKIKLHSSWERGMC